MAIAEPKKGRRVAKIVIGSLSGISVCCCISVFILFRWASSDPSFQATGTARSVSRQAGTAEVIAQATIEALPTNTLQPTPTPTRTTSPTLSPTVTPTSTVNPSFTPSTPTQTATFTNTPTLTTTPTSTRIPTKTPIPTNTPLPTKTSIPTNTPIPTRTPTPTYTPTPIPNTAGLTDWIIYEGKMIGVKDIAFNKYLGYFRAEEGKIYVSLYVVGINASDSETSFYESDIALVDGGGEVTSGVIFGEKEPEFSSCTLKPGGVCEGWWTTMIWDRPEVKDKLTFRWDPCFLFCDAMETPIRQK